MRFLGTQDISLRAEKDALELNIQKAGMSGAEKRDPQSVAKMRQRLSEIYTRLDPAKAVKEQVKANQGTRFNPGMGDYDPLNMNLQTAMALIDRKYGNQPGYLKARDQVKYSIQSQIDSKSAFNKKAQAELSRLSPPGLLEVRVPQVAEGTDVAGVLLGARNKLTEVLKRDPGGAKAATLEARNRLIDAQKTTTADLEGVTDPFEIANILMQLQGQGGMDRPLGGGMANRPNISPYGNSLLAQTTAAAGMVTDQMRPSESIPSTQGILGKDKGVQADALIKSAGSMFDPAVLATPISGAADLADMAFRSLDPVARQQVEKELKGATKEEQDTFIARMLGMLLGGVIQGKMINRIVNPKILNRPLPKNLEATLESMRPQGAKVPDVSTGGDFGFGATGGADDVSGVGVAFRPKVTPDPAADVSGVGVSFRPKPETANVDGVNVKFRPKDKPKNQPKAEVEPTPVADPTVTSDFTPGQKVKVKRNGGRTADATVTDVTPESVGIQTAGGEKKFYATEDAKAILTPDEPVVAKAADITPATGGPDAPVVTTPEPVVAKTPDVPESQPVALDGGGTSQPDFSVGERVVMPYSGKNGTNVEAVITAVTPDDVTVKIKGGKSVTYPTIVAKSGFRRIISPDPTAPKTAPPAPKVAPEVTPAAVKPDAPVATAPEPVVPKATPEVPKAPEVAKVPEPTKAPEVAPKNTTPISPDEPRSYVTVNGEQYVATGETHKRYQAARKTYEGQVDRIKRGFNGLLSREQQAAQLKGVGLQHSAEVRDILGLRTPKELEAALTRANKMTPGVEVVDPLGKTGVVTSNAYGKIGVQYPDGGTGTFPRKDVTVLNSKAESITKPNPEVRKMSDLQAESAAPKTTPDATPNQSAQPSLGMMDEGGGGKAPPPGGTAPGTTPPGQPKRRNPKQPRQAGKADLKTLGAAAGVAGAGAVAIFKGDIDRAIEENDLEGVRDTLIKMGLGTAALSVILQKGRTGLVNATRHSFDPFRYILDPRSLEKIAPDGVFKNALADVLSISDLYKIKTARAMMDLEDAAEGAFGKKRDLKKGQLGMKAKDSPVYKEWNTKFRDHVEQNVANGKKWDDGVPPQFAKFASAAIKTMDKFLDEWEAMGGRIKVVNDGVQQAKIQVGASLKLATGEWAEYQGFSKRKDGKVKLQVEVVNAAGKKVMREIAPGEEFGRPVYRLGEAYVPRIYTRSFINQIIEGKPEFKTALNNSAVKAGGSPLTDAEFVSLQDFARGFAETDSPTKVNSFMASLEKERTLQFAKLEYTDAKGNKIVLDPYENSYFDAVRKSTEKASKRIAVAETLGIDSDVIARVIDGVRGVDYDGANYLTELVGNLLDLGPKAPNPFSKVARVSAWESRYQAATKLLGGTSAISQFADIVIPLTEFGPVTVGRAIQKLVKDPTFKSDISAFNGGTAAYLKEMSGIENVGSKAEIGASKFVDTGMTVVQMKQMDKTMKRINTASVVTEVERLGTKIEKGKTLTDPETRMLDRLGMTRWQDSIKNVGIKKTMKLEKFQAEIAGHARTFMYSGAVEDMPQWMSTPTGAMVMRFKKPWYVATKTLMQGALNEAAHGNYTPLARGIAYSVGVGAGAQYLKDIVKTGIFDQEAKEMLFAGNFEGALKRMFVDVPSESNYLAKGFRGIRDDKAAGLMQLFGLVAQTIYESGSTGVAGEVLPLKQRGQVENRQYNYWERFEPISSQSARRYIFGMGGDIAGVLSGTMTPEKAGANIYETVRSEVIPARRVFDALSYKPDEVVRREGERKIKRENATVDKNMPEKMRREQQQYKAYGEKIQRKIINEATPKF